MKCLGFCDGDLVHCFATQIGQGGRSKVSEECTCPVVHLEAGHILPNLGKSHQFTAKAMLQSNQP